MLNLYTIVYPQAEQHGLNLRVHHQVLHFTAPALPPCRQIKKETLSALFADRVSFFTLFSILIS